VCSGTERGVYGRTLFHIAARILTERNEEVSVRDKCSSRGRTAEITAVPI
jgi:hypothetical protein